MWLEPLTVPIHPHSSKPCQLSLGCLPCWHWGEDLLLGFVAFIYLCRFLTLILVALPCDLMSVDTYATNIKQIAIRIERWTWAVFGLGFTSLDRTYSMGTQTDTHSCNVCVINVIKVSILGDVLFIWETCFRLQLEYFTEAAEYILQGPVTVGIRVQSNLENHLFIIVISQISHTFLLLFPILEVLCNIGPERSRTGRNTPMGNIVIQGTWLAEGPEYLLDLWKKIWL